MLGDHQFVVANLEALRPCAHRVAGNEIVQHHRLLEEAAAIDAVLVIDDVGIDHRDAAGPRRRLQAQRRGEGGLDAGVERAVRIEIGLDEVDHQQCRALAEADALAEGPLVVGFEVLVTH